jgi:hypothetical protein
VAYAVHSLHLPLNLDGSVDGRYPLGGKPQVQPATLGINLAAFQSANYQLSARVGTGALSFNYRTFLTGTSAATAVFSVNATSGSLGDWAMGTDTLTNPNTTAGSGALQVVASDGVNTVSFPIQSWALNSSLQLVQWSPGHGMMNNHAVKGGEADAGLSSSPVLGEINNINGTVCVDYKLSLAWSAVDKGPVSFTGSVGGASSGTLTAALTNGPYVFKFGNGEFRNVTVTGTAVAWSGALAAGSVTTAKVYRFSFPDEVLNKLQTAYDRPYKMSLVYEYGAFSSVSPSAAGAGSALIPDYLQHDVATYGQAGKKVAGVVTNFSGVSGFWGGDNQNTYAPQFYRSSIADAYIDLVQATGFKYNNNAGFNVFDFRENSFAVGALANNSAPGWSNSGFDTQMRRIAQAMKTAFPNRPCAFCNTFYQGGGSPINGETYTTAFTDYLYSIGVNISAADTITVARESWGMKQFAGTAVTGSATPLTDHRALGRKAQVEVEGPDYSLATLAVIYDTAVNYVKAATIWWCIRTDTNVPTNVQWANLKVFLAANPIPAANMTYPSNY